ncbi:MAG: hypothetical protein FWC96_09140 [Oscillospiraceae bacterium]|nr:hypothetical protein [Oscillospiraceae bacterium]
MILNIAKHESIGGIEGGVYYFHLPNFPHISVSELKTAVAFIMYERLHNRQTEIICEDKQILATVNNAVANPHAINPFILSDTTEFVYHATDTKGAQKILSCGKLLSAVNVYGRTGEELAYEKRNSPWNDPVDYFEYIMFCNGDDMTGDYVVLSDNFPSEEALGKGNFDAAVRLYIRSEDIMRHQGYVFDGYHPAKVKDEIILADYLYACIVPEQYKKIENHISPELAGRTHYLAQKGLSISDWNNKVYDFVCNL